MRRVVFCRGSRPPFRPILNAAGHQKRCENGFGAASGGRGDFGDAKPTKLEPSKSLLLPYSQANTLANKSQDMPPYTSHDPTYRPIPQKNMRYFTRAY